MKKEQGVVLSDKNIRKSDQNMIDACRDTAQVLGPSYIGYNEDCLKVDDNYVRTFAVNGYPPTVDVGFMDKLYHSNTQNYVDDNEKGDLDVIEYIDPIKDKIAKDTLTSEITKYETQLLQEYQRESNKNITWLQDKIADLYAQRKKVEKNYAKMFILSVFAALYNADKKTLDKESKKLMSRLDGDQIILSPLFMRDIEGYKTCSPYAVNSVPKFGRNIDTEALTDFFPFYHADINHPGGIPIAINKYLKKMIYIDFFNFRLLSNANGFISGKSGSGKSYFASLLTNRSILIDAVKTAIIDVEGEFVVPTKAIGGACVKIAIGSNCMLNPFDIAVEYEMDKDGRPTGVQKIDIKGKVSELISMFGIMRPEYIADSVVHAHVATCLQMLYHNFGFTEDPNSLYDEIKYFDEDTESYVSKKVKKTMPRISDARAIFFQYADQYGDAALYNFAESLSEFAEGGIYDLFDCYTKLDIDENQADADLDLTEYPCIDFDLSGVDDENLRPIVMYVIMTWIWTRFIKTDLKTKKRIVCDEAWTMLSDRFKGTNYTAGCLENYARRIRKYNGSLFCITQNFREFATRKEGLAILSNSAVKMFFNHEQEDIAAVEGRFLLTDGEKQFILSADRGDFLLKIGKETVVAYSQSFDFEDKMLSKEYLKAGGE